MYMYTYTLCISGDKHIYIYNVRTIVYNIYCIIGDVYIIWYTLYYYIGQVVCLDRGGWN